MQRQGLALNGTMALLTLLIVAALLLGFLTPLPTIVLLAALFIPYLLGMSRAASHVALELGWLFGMTVIGLLLLIPAKGVTRVWGAALIVLYLVFVVVHVLWPHI